MDNHERSSHAKYSVNKQFVKILLDIHCFWHGKAPSYRIYVNDELFVERTFIWANQYLCEMLQIEAPPGQYTVKVVPVTPCKAKFQSNNFRIEYGPARWIDNTTLEIRDES